jgi:hypothetical protein
VAQWLLSGRIIDAIIVLIALEALLFWWLRRIPSGRRWLPGLGQLLPNLLSGAVLMLTLRFALTDAPWWWIAGGLSAALLCHCWDLWARITPVRES